MDPRGSQQDDSAGLEDSLDPVQGKTTMNIPILSILWVVFFCICFVIFLVLSLCSDTNCSWCDQASHHSKKGNYNREPFLPPRRETTLLKKPLPPSVVFKQEFYC